MRCPWCHNPESLAYAPEVVWHGGRCLGDQGCVEVCPEHALAATVDGIAIDRRRCRGCGQCVEFCPSAALEVHGRTVPVDELFRDVARDAVFYETSGGGVTLSGGEPLAQPDAALALLRLLKGAGIHTALDTCGAVGERVLREALDMTDLVLFDVKVVDPGRCEAWTGVPFQRVAASARLVNASGVPVWVRTPVIPGYTDDDAAIRDVARFVAGTFAHCQRHDLLAFSNLCTSKYEQLGRRFALAGAPLLDVATMERLCAVVREEGSPDVRWSGPTQAGEDIGAFDASGLERHQEATT